MNKFDEKTLSLIEIGFIHIGDWILENEFPIIKDLTNPEAIVVKNSKPALYAFIVDGELKYIGKTAQILFRRLYGYIKPGNTTATNKKVHSYIKELLKKKHTVVVLGFSPDIPLCYGGYKINLPAGLEDILIEKMNPEWNGRQPNTAKPESESATYEREANPEINIPIQSANISQVGSPTFNIVLGQTYYDKGFMNPGIDVDNFIGGDGEPMLIHLGDVNQDSVRSIINRTATQNGTARINPRAAVRDWFQENFSMGETVKATIINPNEIVLSKP